MHQKTTTPDAMSGALIPPAADFDQRLQRVNGVHCSLVVSTVVDSVAVTCVSYWNGNAAAIIFNRTVVSITLVATSRLSHHPFGAWQRLVHAKRVKQRSENQVQ
jgi:hypothetical protein